VHVFRCECMPSLFSFKVKNSNDNAIIVSLIFHREHWNNNVCYFPFLHAPFPLNKKRTWKEVMPLMSHSICAYVRIYKICIPTYPILHRQTEQSKPNTFRGLGISGGPGLGKGHRAPREKEMYKKQNWD
jgi:hypothetical protein